MDADKAVDDDPGGAEVLGDASKLRRVARVIKPKATFRAPEVEALKHRIWIHLEAQAQESESTWYLECRFRLDEQDLLAAAYLQAAERCPRNQTDGDGKADPRLEGLRGPAQVRQSPSDEEVFDVEH